MENRMDMFNGFINLYNNGRFFRQRDVAEDFWAEDPTALTELLVSDSQWYDQYFWSTSKKLTSLLRHNNTWSSSASGGTGLKVTLPSLTSSSPL